VKCTNRQRPAGHPWLSADDREHEQGAKARTEVAVPRPPQLMELRVPAPLPPRKRPLRPIPEGTTTIVVRNVPREYTQEEVIMEWIPDGSFNYLHIPQMSKMQPFGFAYINFNSYVHVLAFQERWHGRHLSKYPFKRPLDIAPSNTQGLHENLACLRGAKAHALGESGLLPLLFMGTARLDTWAVISSMGLTTQQEERQVGVFFDGPAICMSF